MMRLTASCFALAAVIAQVAPLAHAATCESDGCSAEDTAEASSLLQFQQRRQRSSIAASTPAPAAPIVDDSSKFIPLHLAFPPSNVSGPNPKCTYEESDDNCSMSSHGSTTDWFNVFPGGETQCIDGSEYFFTVHKGKDTQKLHLHFQGGGACWDFASYNLKIRGKNLCFHSVEEPSPIGAFNITNPENPWRDYSFIIINYCAGDMHGGHSTHRWKPNLFNPVVNIRGADNAWAAIQYGLENFPEVDQLTISGSSAGALGVQLWTRKVMDLFSGRSKDMVSIVDSFVGVLYPPEQQVSAESALFKVWDMCNPLLLTPWEITRCNSESLLLQEVWSSAMQKYPNARFLSMNSKADAVQIMFERAFEASQLSWQGLFMTTGEFYKGAIIQLKQWLSHHENFYTYLVDGEQHTYLPQEAFDTATPGTPTGGPARPKMINWLADLLTPEGSANSLKTVCIGDEKVILADTPAPNKTDYCAAALAGVA